MVHINATSKNAADDKLRQSLRRFAQSYSAPASVILVSGDINFAAELSDLRHRHNLRVICLHNAQAQNALLTCAHEAHRFDLFTADLPFTSTVKVNFCGQFLFKTFVFVVIEGNITSLSRSNVNQTFFFWPMYFGKQLCATMSWGGLSPNPNYISIFQTIINDADYAVITVNSFYNAQSILVFYRSCQDTVSLNGSAMYKN